jgi:hypothetical protein
MYRIAVSIDQRADGLKHDLLKSLENYVSSLTRRVVETEAQRTKCSATTAKGSTCKNLALVGGSLCACHSKTKVQKVGRKPKAKVNHIQCHHTHDLDDILHQDCQVCQSLGNRENTECYVTDEIRETIANLLSSF